MKTLLAVISLGLLLVGCGKKEVGKPQTDAKAPSTAAPKEPAQPSASDLTTPPPFAETKAKAEEGDAIAQSNLGFMYRQGQGVAQDFKEAVKWFQKAADQGDANGQKILG